MPQKVFRQYHQNLEEKTEDTTNLAGRHLTPLERRGATPTAQTNQENQKGFYDNLKRGAKMLILGVGLMGLTALAGCATAGSAVQNDIGYEKFFDSYGDYKLVGRNNDIYKEKFDGSESEQLTHTPNVKEGNADFSKNGGYIMYSEERPDIIRFFRIKFDSDDSTKQEISGLEYVHLRDSE